LLQKKKLSLSKPKKLSMELENQPLYISWDNKNLHKLTLQKEKTSEGTRTSHYHTPLKRH